MQPILEVYQGGTGVGTITGLIKGNGINPFTPAVPGTDFGTPFLVAASDAPANIIAVANYVCDGTSDEVQINLALSDLPAAGGRVILSEGHFSISGTINMTTAQQLVGAGFGTILTAANGLNSDIISVIESGDISWGNVIKGMYIDGNQNNQSSGNGIVLSSCYQAIVENVWVRYVWGYGIKLTAAGGQVPTAYNTVRNSLFTDGYLANAVGIYSDGTKAEFNFFEGCNTDFHTGNQGKGIYINSGNNYFCNGQSDYNGYNLYIGGNVHNKFIAYSFDRALYKEIYITGGAYQNIFIGCQTGYYIVAPLLSGTISSGATVTSIALQSAVLQDIPTYGVTVVVGYGTGHAENFTVTSAGRAAGQTSILVNSKVATQNHSAGEYVVLRYRGVDLQGSSGPNSFVDCIFQNGESLPTNINWDKVVGEDSGCTAIYEGNFFNSGSLSLQATSIFSPTNVLGTRIADLPFIGSGGTIDNEVVAGSATTFTLAHTPLAGTVKVYGQGQRLFLTADYTISGAVITPTTSYLAGQIVAEYRYNP